MLKKKAVVFGLIGTIVAGFGFAGCAGAQSSVGDVETTEVVDTVATAANGGESGASENGAETSTYEAETDESDPEVDASVYDIPKAKEVNGKYVYTILDGKVEVPLDHKVDDYVSDHKDGKFFYMYKLAKELGYVNDLIREDEKSNVWELSRDGDRVSVWLLESSTGHYGAGGHENSMGLEMTVTGKNTPLEDISVNQSPGSNLEKAVHITMNGYTNISMDQIIMTMYALEYEAEHICEDPFKDLFSEVMDTSNMSEKNVHRTYRYDEF